MNKELEKYLKRNITHEQKVRLSLIGINQSIKYGTVFVCGFILMLICSITKSFLFGMVALLGMYTLFITLLIVIYKDRISCEEILDYYEKKNKKRSK